MNTLRPPRVLAIVQAGGAGSRMDVLTRERAKPALPFAGVLTLVDFPLSNLTHSGLSDVWLSVQYQASSLQEEVENGRPWDLDRTRGGLRLLLPEQGTGSLDEDGFARGNADELFRIRDQIAAFDADVLLVMSADHVYRYDYRDLVEAHLSSAAECTLLTSTVDLEEAGDHAVVEVSEGRVTGFAYKPAHPTTDVVATEVIAYDPAVLLPLLDDLHVALGPDADAGDSGLGDFGEHLVPALVERGATRAVALDGYWRDVGQPHLYLEAHRELLANDRGILNAVDWPILTRQAQGGPARIVDGAVVRDSLISHGCVVGGSVIGSVLGPRVHVEAGACVVDSVVFADVRIRAGASVGTAIVDVGCDIAEDAQVGEPRQGAEIDPETIVLVGRDCRVGAASRVAAGARLEPGAHASSNDL